MSNDNELEIVLKLVDEASGKLKEIIAGVKKDTEGIGKESDKAAKTIGEKFKDAGKAIKELRREMFAVTIVATALYMSIKEYAKYNYEANLSVQKFEKGLSLLKVTLGGVVYEFLKTGSLLGTMKNIIASSDNITSFVLASKIMDANNELKDFKRGLEEINILYLTGQMSAQQYYNIISSNNVANYQTMQMQMTLMQQMAQQENLMNNQSLMDYSTNIQSRMGLLKTLQQYHHTAYSTMMDFANMSIQKISTGMGSAVSSIVTGTKKASEAWKEFGKSMIAAVVEFVVEYAAQMMIAWALSKVIVASTIAQAAAIATAWFPAALFASIATLGSASAAGVAGMAAATTAGATLATSTIATAIQTAMTVGTQEFASGGWINEPIYGIGASGKRYTFGERGSEYVIPNNRLNSSGNQTSIRIEINNPTLSNKDDIDYLTEEVSRRVAREIERI